MNLQTEIKWIETALKESNDPTFIEAVKNLIKSLRKVKASSLIEQKYQDELMAEAEADIKAGRLHSQDDVQKMIENWTMK